MPIPLTNLDDRTYADLMEEMKALIPRYAPEWTDHNESDPGIMLVELFAWITEAMIYRLNRIPDASRIRFLKLLGAPLNEADIPAESLEAADLDELQAQTVKALRKRWRAITAEDFERLVLENRELGIARAKCLPQLNIEAEEPFRSRPGHVTVLVIPHSQANAKRCVSEVYQFLDQRRLITCRHHVVLPGSTPVRIRAEVAGISGMQRHRIRGLVTERLREFFHPLRGGPDREGQGGWPFGRDVHVSEVFQVIEETSGVEHVESMELLTKDESGAWIDSGDHIHVAINNVVAFEPHSHDIRIIETETF